MITHPVSGAMESSHRFNMLTSEIQTTPITTLNPLSSQVPPEGFQGAEMANVLHCIAPQPIENKL